VAILEDARLMEIHYGHPTQERIVGNIYRGRVEDVLPGLGSAFVDVGERQSLFLSQGEINDQLLIERGFKPWHGPAPIQTVLRPGQSLVLQVRRDGIGSKNPQGTTKVSLPGRFWILLPTEDRLAASRRLSGVRTQRRLRRVAREIRGDGHGLIARTAAEGASREELEGDYRLLAKTWEGIERAASSTSKPRLLYKTMGLVQTILRDRLLNNVREVIVDSTFLYEKIQAFLEYMNMTSYRDRIRVHSGGKALFDTYGLEAQIQQSLARRVDLEGGGWLVIDETEALVAIDVNTGSDVRHRNQQAAILNTNLEAAREIARQLRLRQIAGIIVVDFVDMASEGNQAKLVEQLKAELRKDRVSADFVDITELGLVEITRKRRGESLAEMLENAAFDA
jgi:ribonuclease G